MNIVVDANKLISAAITPYGKTADIILHTPLIVKFAPDFLIEEFLFHRGKAFKFSKLSIAEFKTVTATLLRQLTIIEVAEIHFSMWKKAGAITKPIDQKDTPYVALSIHTGAKLWTGDKPLIKQLEEMKIPFVSTITLESYIKR